MSALCCILWYLHQYLWESHNIVTSFLNSSEKRGITLVYKGKMSHSITEKLGDLVEQGRVIPCARGAAALRGDTATQAIHSLISAGF